MPVTYEAAQTLKCTVNFNFSRYITKNLIKPIPIRYQVLGDTQSEVDRDNEQYGDSVPQGSFGITGQGANRDPIRHSASNTYNNNNQSEKKSEAMRKSAASVFSRQYCTSTPIRVPDHI